MVDANRDAMEQAASEEPVEGLTSPGAPPDAEDAGEPDLPPEAADVALGFVRQVLQAMRLDADARLVGSHGNQIDLELVGEDVALLIGKHGQTLDALQFLTCVVTGRRLGARPRIVVDAEGYRERRAEALRRMALSLAREAVESGQEAVMEGLNAAERRIIHTALVDEPGVSTYSEGEEPNRRVVITPTD